MKINVGIVGYGNLGKATEKLILSNHSLNLVAIFSRRNVISKFDTAIEPYENFILYKNKIDIMFLCGGSKSDLEIQTPEILEYFDCINTFDTHLKIKNEFEKLNLIAKRSNHRLIMSCGWDPGIFSIIRVLFKAIGDKLPLTFWGKGISMGHSDAIRRVDDVVDGIEFTIPNKKIISMAKQGEIIDNSLLHIRECYVVADSMKEQRIEKQIKNIPNYFKGQNTIVNFVSSSKLNSLKRNLSHKGEVIETFSLSPKSKYKMNFSVSMTSNPEFTAKIMLAFANAICILKQNNSSGAFTTIDIPVSYLLKNRDEIFSLC